MATTLVYLRTGQIESRAATLGDRVICDALHLAISLCVNAKESQVAFRFIVTLPSNRIVSPQGIVCPQHIGFQHNHRFLVRWYPNVSVYCRRHFHWGVNYDLVGGVI